MKLRIILLCALAVAMTAGCKKKQKPAMDPAPAAQPADAVKAAANAVASAIPEVALTGTAAENLVNVFEAGVNALKAAPDAKAGAALLTGLLAKYNVADLRAKSKAAKEAGQGASGDLKAKFASLKDQYKEISTKLGSSDPDGFGKAAAEFAKAWGLN